ncbi:MAG: pyridoxamine 5'-phosphate oxidase family protein [Candidatus Omnitrophica bacterium]|nr:pyridoxamine 5'-phosphate oxidase family protein [Candidatus Omnitrophota bacterium]MCF7894768.1 pyridoxamine 5'-phosphate oxidase family protein [Candidatus Omnitrophota bacterium]
MKEIPDNVIQLLKERGYVIVSTLDRSGGIHCSAKGVVDIKEEGRIYLIDLYKQSTYNNLKRNPTISITAIDEHQFIGFTLKGKTNIVKRDKIKNKLIKQWEQKIVERISKRVIKNVKKDRGSTKHPESRFPQPEYLIEMEVDQIIDLTPTHLKGSVLN